MTDAPLTLPPDEPFGFSSIGVVGKLRVCIGAVDVSNAYRSSRMNLAINTLAKAEILLDPKHPAVALIDFTGEVAIDTVRGEDSSRRFTGSIVDVHSEDDLLVLTCETSPDMRTRRIGGLHHTNCPGIDLIYMLLRTGGIPEDRIRVEGLDKLRYELFEVFVPLEGVCVDPDARLGGVSIVQSDAVLPALRKYDNESPLRKIFEEVKTYALTYVGAQVMFDAENAGIAAIDTAIAWLIVRNRHSALRLPDGDNYSWSRESLAILPRRTDCVLVRGVSTNRSWLRNINESRHSGSIDLTARPAILKPTLFDRLSPTQRQAIIAGARAAASTDPIDQVTSLWEAIEHYVADTKVPALFTRSELKEVRKAIPSGLAAEKDSRIREMIGHLNTPPLFVRLRYRLAVDGVPVSEAELELLSSLRKVRNDVVHGRIAYPPDEDSVNYGVAIVARMLVYLMHHANR